MPDVTAVSLPDDIINNLPMLNLTPKTSFLNDEGGLKRSSSSSDDKPKAVIFSPFIPRDTFAVPEPLVDELKKLEHQTSQTLN